MTKSEFKILLYEHGYKTHKVVLDKEGWASPWDIEHEGWMYQKFGDTEVAIFIPDDRCNIWLSIEELDTGIELDIHNVHVLNMVLALFDAPIINVKHHDYKIEDK